MNRVPSTLSTNDFIQRQLMNAKTGPTGYTRPSMKDERMSMFGVRSQSAPPGEIQRPLSRPSFLMPAQEKQDKLQFVLICAVDYIEAKHAPVSHREVENHLMKEMNLSPNNEDMVKVFNAFKAKKNPKIEYDEATDSYTYQGEYRVQNAQDILVLLGNCYPGGKSENELLDVYANVKRDLEQLMRDNKIYCLQALSKQKGRILYLRKPVIADLSFDADEISAWRAMSAPKLPDATDVTNYLRNNKLPVMGTFRDEKPGMIDALLKDKSKSKRGKRPLRFANTHIPELRATVQQ